MPQSKGGEREREREGLRKGKDKIRWRRGKEREPRQKHGLFIT